MKLSVRLNSIGSIRAFQIFQLCRFTTLLAVGILLTKSTMHVRDIGSYESLIFLSGAFSFFWVSGILNGLITRYNQNEKAVFHNTAVLLTALSVILAAAMFFIRDFFLKMLPPEAQSYYPLLIIFILLNNPAFLNEYILLLKEKSLTLIKYGFMILTGYILAIAIPVFSGYGLKECMYGLIIYALLKNFYLIHLLKKYCTQQTNISFVMEHFLFSLPLMISMLVSGSADYIDGFLVTTHFGSDAFAIFRYGAKELPLAVLLSSAMSNAFVPKIAGRVEASTDYSQLKRESLRLMHLLFPVSILLLVLSTYIYPFVFRSEFLSSAPIFNTFLLLLVSRMVFPQTLVIAAGKTGVIFRVALVELSLNVVCSYVLLHYLGMLGVALGTLVAFYAEKILLAIYVYYKLGIPASSYIPWKTWLFYSTLLLITYFLHFWIFFL